MLTEKKKELKRKANTLPLLPGVYIMKDAADNIIYIGKAIKLKNRVTQYFGSETNHAEKVRRMTSKVNDFDYIVCDSEFEALTLENSLIKQYMPKYNILLKDDKGYHYVHITDEKWRRIEAVKNDKGKGTFIGPYNSGRVVKQTVEQAQKIFKLPDCSRNFDKPSKPCLNFHIGQCSAPCRNKITVEDYNESLEAAISFIKKGGAAADDIEVLREKMEKAANELNFEYAARLRDRINSINKITEKQKVIVSDTLRHDCIASVMAADKICVQVFVFKNGHLNDSEHFVFDAPASKEEFYAEFLPQYYQSRDIPKEIWLDCMPETEKLLERWLSE
ncbi:MAG: excinuclease ABC subunit C [Clostridiales bacterium]|nr:excinuclease ABC subunit C [Candidatus Equinaster intestinalis]